MIAFIWAEDLNGGIGIDGHLPWHIAADLRKFKEETMGHPMIMGRKTFESLPGVLPHRKHIVLTHSDLKVDSEAVSVIHSKESLDEWLVKHDNDLNFIIGGATLFEMYKDNVDYLYQTIIKKEYKTDTIMPKIDFSKFKLIEQKSFENIDPEFEFLTYEKI